MTLNSVYTKIRTPSLALQKVFAAQRKLTSRRVFRPASQCIELATIALGRATSTTVAFEDGREDITLRRRRAVVLVALDRECCTNALRDQAADDEDPVELMHPRLDPIVDGNLR